METAVIMGAIAILFCSFVLGVVAIVGIVKGVPITSVANEEGLKIQAGDNKNTDLIIKSE